MATDGVKIIDGDLAHDTYWGIMDLYDSNVDITTLQNEIPFERNEYGTKEDFYHEIFVTSYSLAFWEIGEMTNEILDEVRSVIEKGAGVKVWSEQGDLKDGKARQKELDKLWSKISQPNSKIRARKKYRKISNFYFQVNDLLSFKLDDNFYRAVVCTSIDQYRGECNYMLTPTTFRSKNKPTVQSLFDNDIFGIIVESCFSKKMTIENQPGVDTLWNLYPEHKKFFFGLVKTGIDHKDFISFKKEFEKIGILEIKKPFKESGSTGALNTLERYKNTFKDYENQLALSRYHKFPVTLICDR